MGAMFPRPFFAQGVRAKVSSRLLKFEARLASTEGQLDIIDQQSLGNYKYSILFRPHHSD